MFDIKQIRDNPEAYDSGRKHSGLKKLEPVAAAKAAGKGD